MAFWMTPDVLNVVYQWDRISFKTWSHVLNDFSYLSTVSKFYEYEDSYGRPAGSFFQYEDVGVSVLGSGTEFLSRLNAPSTAQKLRNFS